MNPLFAALTVASSCLIAVVNSGAAPAGEGNHLITNSTVRSLVTPSEIGQIIQIARAWGFHDFVEITTVSAGGQTNIALKAREERKGRKVTSRELTMNRAHWMSHIQALEEGRLHIFSNTVKTNETAVRMPVNFNGRKIELLIPDEMSPEQAQVILEAFAAGRLKYSKPELRARLEKADLTRPLELFKSRLNGAFSVGFPCGDCCELIAIFKTSGREMLLIDVSEAWC
jgi:hypothetical protein